MNENRRLLACLLPTGSARETVPGSSHLFEHLVIQALGRDYRTPRIKGQTREDYVILFCHGLAPGDVIRSIRLLDFPPREFENHKSVLIEEIEYLAPGEEGFFSFLWQGSSYERSPLGRVEDVERITSTALRALKLEVLRKPVYFFSEPGGVEVFNEGQGNPVPNESLEFSWKRRMTFKGRLYDICYFTGRVEAFYLLVRVLKVLNPGKHIQLSEKRRKSALVLESGTLFPGEDNVEALRGQALSQLSEEFSALKADIKSRALNELESAYFYGIDWQGRIASCLSVAGHELLELVEEIDS